MAREFASAGRCGSQVRAGGDGRFYKGSRKVLSRFYNGSRRFLHGAMMQVSYATSGGPIPALATGLRLSGPLRRPVPKRCEANVVPASVAFACCGLLRRKRRAARHACSAVRMQETQHSRAVRKWLKEVVIGLGFCPWASPADIRAWPAL